MQDKLEEYLRKSHRMNVIDHSIRCSLNDKGEIVFYIHPSHHDGQTLDFKVIGNELIPMINLENMR